MYGIVVADGGVLGGNRQFRKVVLPAQVGDRNPFRSLAPARADELRGFIVRQMSLLASDACL